MEGQSRPHPLRPKVSTLRAQAPKGPKGPSIALANKTNMEILPNARNRKLTKAFHGPPLALKPFSKSLYQDAFPLFPPLPPGPWEPLGAPWNSLKRLFLVFLAIHQSILILKPVTIGSYH